MYIALEHNQLATLVLVQAFCTETKSQQITRLVYCGIWYLNSRAFESKSIQQRSIYCV
jgi:hypothetical protein